MTELSVPIGRNRRPRSVLETDGGSVRGFSFSIRRASVDVIDGNLTLYLQDKPVGKIAGTHLTAHGWDLFLERLANAWPYLRVEETYPQRATPKRPSDLASVLLSSPTAHDLVLRQVEMFRERHDIASWCSPAHSGESLFLLREGNYFVAEGNGLVLRLHYGDVLRTLHELGDAVAALLEADGGGAHVDVLQDWRRREEVSADKLESIATGIDEARVVALHRVLPKRTPEEIFAGMDEVQAAARGLAPVMGDGDIEKVVATIRSQPRIDTPALDLVARRAERKLASLPYGAYPPGRVEGLAMARWFRETVLGVGEDSRFDVDRYLSGLGIPVEKLEMQADVEAVAYWGPTHGPGILLNSTGRRSRVRHEGYDGGARFTLAHELCHLLLDTRGSLPVADVVRGMRPSMVEERANAFAAEVLLPERGVAHRYRNGQGLDEVIAATTKAFGVTRTLTAYQLQKVYPEGSTILLEADRRRLQEIVNRRPHSDY